MEKGNKGESHLEWLRGQWALGFLDNVDERGFFDGLRMLDVSKVKRKSIIFFRPFKIQLIK